MDISTDSFWELFFFLFLISFLSYILLFFIMQISNSFFLKLIFSGLIRWKFSLKKMLIFFSYEPMVTEVYFYSLNDSNLPSNLLGFKANCKNSLRSCSCELEQHLCVLLIMTLVWYLNLIRIKIRRVKIPVKPSKKCYLKKYLKNQNSQKLKF